MFATVNNNKNFFISYVSVLLIISIMELEFDTQFKHPLSMVVSGSLGSWITLFTKHVLNKSHKQFENVYWFYSEWQDGYKDCPGISFVLAMQSSLDAYLEFSVPKAIVFDDMKCANSDLIAQTFTQKRHHQNVKLILHNLY